jgi:hypothetical protein
VGYAKLPAVLMRILALMVLMYVRKEGFFSEAFLSFLYRIRSRSENRITTSAEYGVNGDIFSGSGNCRRVSLSERKAGCQTRFWQPKVAAQKKNWKYLPQ